MAEVNWDDALYKAENSPRSVLAKMLDKADGLRAVIVIAVTTTAVDEEYFEYDSSGSSFEVLGLLQAALDDLREKVKRGVD